MKFGALRFSADIEFYPGGVVDVEANLTHKVIRQEYNNVYLSEVRYDTVYSCTHTEHR